MKTGIILIAAALLAGVFGVNQHQRLEFLKAQIAARPRTFPMEKEASAASRIASNVAAEPGTPARSGAELIQETLSLIQSLKGGGEPGPKILLWDRESPEAIRLGELLSSMDLDATSKLIDSVGDAELRVFTFREISRANPRAGFLSRIALPIDLPELRPDQLFIDWATVDPAGAVRWFREAQASHQPAAAIPGIRESAAIAEARIDSARSVRSIASLLQDRSANPGNWSGGEIGFRLADSLRSNQERLQFLSALRESFHDPEIAGKLADFRQALIKQLSTPLRTEPADESIPVLDSAFTPEEKQTFANDLSRSITPANPRNRQWISWLASLDLPANEEHPLLLMAKQHPIRGDLGEPGWLDQIPSGELKNQIIGTCAMEIHYHDPELAARYVALLPDGREKTELQTSLNSPPIPGEAETGVIIGPVDGE